MPDQTGQNVLVAYKEESAFNTPPAPVTGGRRLRLNPTPGLQLAAPTILPGELRADLLTPIARLGSRSVGGNYLCDMSVNSFDDIFESVLRSTFAAAVPITEVEMTSITTTVSTIVAAAGSWITEGVRVGDIVRLTGHSTAANNDINLLVLSVTASTITVVGAPLVVDAVPDVAFTLTILKKLTNAATPTRRSFHIEEYNVDIDQSLLFGGCRWDGMTITGSPDGMATIDLPVVGASVDPLDLASSPFFDTPTLDQTIGLVFVDAQISLGGVFLVTGTAFTLELALGMAGLPVIGSTVTPDVFDGRSVISGSISIVRSDLSRITAFDAETEFELHVLLEEPLGTPKGALSIFIPKLKFTAADAPLGSDGAMIETIPFQVGVEPGTATKDTTMITICTED